MSQKPRILKVKVRNKLADNDNPALDSLTATWLRQE
jgi:hypothetical protein